MKNGNNPLSLGLIGCGWVTENRHLPALQGLPEVRIAALVEINPERLTHVADRFHIERRYSDFLALLEDPVIEVVGVCVPTQFHAEVASAALDAGKHVFIEKPLTLRLEESDHLIAKAATSSSTVMVGFNLRWHRLVRQAREIIRQGTLGPLELIRTVLTSNYETLPEWKRRRDIGGGAFLEQAVHHIDLWRFLLQSEVEEVYAINRSESRDDEVATVTARMTNGVLVSSVFSQDTSENNEVEIYGKAGRLYLSCYRFDGLSFFPTSSSPGDIRTHFRSMAHAVRELPQAALKWFEGGNYIASYRAEWRHFIDCIKKGTPVECTLDDGRCALRVALAAVDSTLFREPVRIGQVMPQAAVL